MMNERQNDDPSAPNYVDINTVMDDLDALDTETAHDAIFLLGEQKMTIELISEQVDDMIKRLEQKEEEIRILRQAISDYEEGRLPTDKPE